MRSIDLGVRLWAIAGILLLLGSGSAPAMAPFLPLFVILGWLGWGAQAWIIRLFLGGAERRSGRTRLRDALAPPLFVLVLWAVSVPVLRWSSTAWAHLELWRHEPVYLELVARLAAGESPEGMDPRPRVDQGEPLRVAFPWGTGLLDNWRAIVHDPTGLVRRAEDAWGAGADDAEARRARDLFGGHVVRCVHLSGAFYFCVFT